MTFKGFLILLFLSLSLLGFSQKKKHKPQHGNSKKIDKSAMADIFDDADYDFSVEDYYSAIKKYQEILKKDSLNANVNYCVGVCYMKTKFDRKKAIPYLVKAIKRVSKKYEEGTYDEKKAKFDALFLLGQAYRLNNELDKAVDVFTAYKKMLKVKDKKNHSIVDNEIESCKNAKKETKNFSSVSQRPVPQINSKFSDYNAVVSSDESIIIFACQQLEGKIGEEKKVMFSKKNNGKWSKPIDISKTLKTNENMIPTYLSPDGKYLLLASNEDANTAIFESKLSMGKNDSSYWSPVKKLNKNINTGKVTHASLSPDGKTMYFTSDRKGGQGGLDIYKSEKEKNNDWGPAVNLGTTINTPQDEESPFFTTANVLYFSSGGHGSIGGLDIFFSKLNDNGLWSNPESLGLMFNTTDDDYFYFPLGDGARGYMSQTGDDAIGEKDIYKIEIIEGAQDDDMQDGFKKPQKSEDTNKKETEQLKISKPKK